MEIRQLNSSDYDDLLSLLNRVFEHKNNRPTDFEKDLPKMWVRDDEHMGRHYGVLRMTDWCPLLVFIR